MVSWRVVDLVEFRIVMLDTNCPCPIYARSILDWMRSSLFQLVLFKLVLQIGPA